METVRISNFKEGAKVLIDIHSCPKFMQTDFITRNANVALGEELCSRCDGTGNELYSLYRKCSACNGSGLTKRAGDVAVQRGL